MRPTAAALLLVCCAAPAHAADLPRWPTGTPAPVRTVRPGPEVDVVDLCPPAPALERSRFTGQPLTVMYNDPGRAPGTVVTDIALVPLPRVARSPIKAAYARGY